MANVLNLFGYHTRNTVWRNDGDKENDRIDRAKFTNCLNAFGYIPIVGIATGIFRMSASCAIKEGEISSRITLAGRGVVEFFGLGILFLIPDLLVSLGRYINYRMQTAESY